PPVGSSTARRRWPGFAESSSPRASVRFFSSKGDGVELTGSSYLYALATTSVTFVGFSALLIVFRQSMGGGLTRYDAYFTLSFIQAGFIVTAGALLPPLLAFYGWTPLVVWRVAAGAIAVPIIWFVASVPGRRRAATGGPTPAFVRALLLLQ